MLKCLKKAEEALMAGNIKACGDSAQDFIILKNPAGGSLNAEKSALWASSDTLRCSESTQKVSFPS